MFPLQPPNAAHIIKTGEYLHFEHIYIGIELTKATVQKQKSRKAWYKRQALVFEN